MYNIISKFKNIIIILISHYITLYLDSWVKTSKFYRISLWYMDFDEISRIKEVKAECIKDLIL
jgi:hypothetical protein